MQRIERVVDRKVPDDGDQSRPGSGRSHIAINLNTFRSAGRPLNPGRESADAIQIVDRFRLPAGRDRLAAPPFPILRPSFHLISWRNRHIDDLIVGIDQQNRHHVALLTILI